MARMTQDIKDQAARIHQTRDNAINSALANQSLSAAGQRLAAATAQLTAQRSMDALQNNFESGAQLTATDLERRLFGSPTPVTGADAVSMRDANDRASQLTDPGEALSMMQTALMTGDDLLARAIARQAYGMRNSPLGALGGWGDVLDAYAEQNPTFASQLRQYSDATASALRDSVDGLIFYLPSPSIIADIPAYRLEQFVSQNGGTVGA